MNRASKALEIQKRKAKERGLRSAFRVSGSPIVVRNDPEFVDEQELKRIPIAHGVVVTPINPF